MTKLHKNELKKVETLFHTTKTLSTLKKIIKNNFLVSYSREVFGNDICHIPMVSFSNVLLFETKSQINYGDYSIGMSKEWAIKNSLHPVSYTYDDSHLEKSIVNLRDFTSIGLHLEYISLYAGSIKVRFKKENKFQDFLDEALKSTENKKLLEHFLELLSPSLIYQELMSKKIVATNKAGKEFICFNDREWRFIPKDVSSYFQYEVQGNTEFENNLNEGKKHYNKTENRLTFNLEDIRFIVVQFNREINKIYEMLYFKYGEFEVQQSILCGNITILSRENLFHNI